MGEIQSFLAFSIVVDYLTSVKDASITHQVLQLIQVGPSVALEKVSVVQVPMVVSSEVQGPEGNRVKGSEESVHLEVGRRLLKKSRGFKEVKSGIFQGGLT